MMFYDIMVVMLIMGGLGVVFTIAHLLDRSWHRRHPRGPVRFTPKTPEQKPFHITVKLLPALFNLLMIGSIVFESSPLFWLGAILLLACLIIERFNGNRRLSGK